MDVRTLALNSLFKESFVAVHRALVRSLKGDVTTAFLLGELVSKYTYYKETGGLQGEWFYVTILNLEETLCIDEYKQRKSMKKLEEMDFIKIRRRGSPPRRYFYINLEEIYKVVMEGKPIKNIKPYSNNKKEFYEKLNNSLYGKIEDFQNSLDNIPQELGGIMFAWARFYYHKGYGKWKWNSTEYGKINNYWKAVYKNRRPYNFDNLSYYFLKQPHEPTIFDFIKYDRGQPETSFALSLAELQMRNSCIGDMEE